MNRFLNAAKRPVTAVSAGAVALVVSGTAAAEGGLDISGAESAITDAIGELGTMGTAILLVGAAVFTIGVIRGLLKA